MMILRGCENVEANRTTNLPKTSFINQSNHSGFRKGYASMCYKHGKGWLFMGIHETIEEAAAVFQDLKNMCYMCPELGSWIEYGDMVIYASNGCDSKNPDNVGWYACAIVVDD